MPYGEHRIDPEKVKDLEAKPVTNIIIDKHNGFVEDVGGLKREFDVMNGLTIEEKADTATALGKARYLVRLFQKKSIGWLSPVAMTYLIIGILKSVGVDLSAVGVPLTKLIVTILAHAAEVAK